MVQKIHLWGGIWVPTSRLMLYTFQEKNDNLAVQYEDVRELSEFFIGFLLVTWRQNNLLVIITSSIILPFRVKRLKRETKISSRKRKWGSKVINPGLLYQH